MDVWDAFVSGKMVPMPVFPGTTRGRIVDKPPPEPTEKVLDSQTAFKLEDEVEEMRGQILDRLKLAQAQPIDDSNNADGLLYDKYSFDRKYSASKLLPIYSVQQEILAKVAAHPTVVIEGSTGCGKSTQVWHQIVRSLEFVTSKLTTAQRKDCWGILMFDESAIAGAANDLGRCVRQAAAL